MLFWRLCNNWVVFSEILKDIRNLQEKKRQLQSTQDKPRQIAKSIFVQTKVKWPLITLWKVHFKMFTCS